MLLDRLLHYQGGGKRSLREVEKSALEEAKTSKEGSLKETVLGLHA